MPSNVWDEITYPVLNLDGAHIKMDIIMDVIIYPCWD